jgi:hypothetical protein
LTFGTKRKKGNIKKTASLRNIAPINYNEGSNDDDEEEDVEEEGGVAYQNNTDIPTVSSYARKSSTTPKRHSSLAPFPSSLQNPHQKTPIKLDAAAKSQSKKKILDLNESGSDNRILEVKQ